MLIIYCTREKEGENPQVIISFAEKLIGTFGFDKITNLKIGK